jgi:hypothetical protein
VTEDSCLGPNFRVTQTATDSEESRLYLQVTGSAVSQHTGDNGPFVESLAVGFVGLPHASAPEDIQESA